MADGDFASYFGETPDLQGQSSYKPPAPTGTGNWLTAGVMSGIHQTASELGGAGEAVGRAIGADHFADNARAFADAQRTAAATYQRPNLESAPWYSPTGIAYRVAQSAPTFAAAIGGSLAGAALAPEAAAGAGVEALAAAAARKGWMGAAGAAASMYPSSVGGNVQRNEDYEGNLSAGNARKALAIGVPEAALQSLGPHYLESGLLKGFGGTGFAGAMAKAAGIQAGAGAATEWAMQAMGDPNRTLADKASDIVSAGLTGGVLGGVTAGILHPFSPAHTIAKTPPNEVPTAGGLASLQGVVDGALNGTPAPATPPVASPAAIVADRVRRAQEDAVAQQQAMAAQTSPLDQLAAIRAGAPIQMPPPADEAARLQQATLDAGRAARPVTRQQATLDARMAALGRPVEGPAQPPQAPAAPEAVTFGQRAEPPAGPQKLLAPPLPAPTPAAPETQPYDWAGERKALQQAKGYSTILKGPFTSHDQLVDTVFNNLNTRLNSDSGAVPKSLLNAAEHLGITQNGQFAPEFMDRANQAAAEAARPPGISQGDDAEAPLAGPTGGRTDYAPPTRVERADIPAAHMGRWDALERARTSLLGDNLSDFRVQELLDKTSSLQDALLKPGKSGDTSWRNIERQTDQIQTEIKARNTEATVTPPVPVVQKDAPAVGPGPSPAAANFIDRAKPPETTDVPQTKQAQAQAKRQGKATKAPPTPAVEPSPQDEIANATTLKEKDAAQEAANGPDRITPEDIAAAKPNPAFQGNMTVPTRDEAIERDGRLWEYRQAAVPPDIEARAQQAEKVQPVPTASRQFATAQDRAKAAREAMLAKREPVDPKVRGDIENQRSPEVVRPRLVDQENDAEVMGQRDLDPNNPQDQREMKRRQINEAAPPVVDPAILAGFQRDGRRIQADVRREAQNDTLRAKLAMIESSRRPMTPVPQKVQTVIDQGKAALDGLRTSGAIIPRHEDFAGKDQRFQQLLSQHAYQMNLVDRAARLGGMEGLREVPRDFFGTDLYDEMSGHVTPQTERNLLQHATAETRVQDAAALARGERPLVRYSTPPTQHDVDLKNVIDQTGDMKQTLAYIRENGTNSDTKVLAHRLLQGGAGGTIEMSDRAPPTGRQPRDGEVLAGMHDPINNHTQIYDGGGMEQTILHEAAHSATEKALRGDGPAARAMKALFERVANRLPEGMYGKENTSEMVAEAFSNPQFAATLKGMKADYGRIGNMWQAFKNGVARVLGLNPRTETLLDQVLDRSNRLMGENVREMSGNVADQVRRGGQQFSELSTQVGNALWRKMLRTGEDQASKTEMAARGVGLSWVTGDQLKWGLKDHIPSAVPFIDTQNHRTVRTDSLAKTLVKAYEDVSHLNPKSRDAWAKLAARTIQHIDGFKTWAQHTWLKGHPQEAELEQEHAQASREADVIRNDPAAMHAWQQSVDANEGAKYLRNLHLLNDFKSREWPDETWVGFHNDPIREFESRTDLQDNPTAAKQWGSDRQKQMVAGMATKVTELDRQYNSLKTAWDNNEQLPSHLRMTLEQATKLQDDMKKALANKASTTDLISDLSALEVRSSQAPYFHIGRGKGDHFVTGHIATDNNVPRDSAIKAIGEALNAKGFKDLAIMRGLDNPLIYMRVESQAQREELKTILEGLQTQGHMDAAKPISAGLAADTSIYHQIGPSWMRQMIEGVKNTPPDYPVGTTPGQKASLDEAHGQQQREMIRALMDMLPDSSLTKAYQKREGVQGFSTDMLNSYKSNAITASRGLANVSLARELGYYATKMSKELEGVNQRSDISGGRRTALAQMLGEVVLRNKLYQAHVPSTFMDTIRRTVHAVQIGASPAYFFTLMSQLPTLTLPELAKTHGYINSAAAMAKATKESFDVMRAVWSDGKGGFHMGNDAVAFGMRREALERAGINSQTIDFLMHLASRGAFNQGAYTEAITGHQVDSAYGALLQKAGVMGRYSEQFPRILTALAAKSLHEGAPQKAGGMSVHDFAYDKVMNSQFNWNPELNARQTTRSGNFGAMSPLINQFMGFQIRMTEKLYRELATGFGAKRSTEEGRQSRTWLYGHAAAVTALAGTLGMPLVSVAASVFDRLADWALGKDDVDVTASYRNFLAQNFGKEMGEAIARGAPRLAGMDFDHLGEGKIVPGSSMLMFATEKRKLEDAEKDWLKNMAGSSMGFIFNSMAASRDILNGDFMDGAIKVAPELLKGPMEAYRLDQRGFVDKNGSKLPITASAADVMMQALGIDPAKEAEYDEAKKVSTGLQQMRQMRSQNITRHLMLAENRGDEGMMQSWQREAMKFAMDHPGMNNPLQDFGRAMGQHARNAAMAQGFGTPIGVSPRDVVGQRMTAFGNFKRGEQ